ncbi:MAG: sialidase family protein [Ignavibacteriaceae bacterium]
MNFYFLKSLLLIFLFTSFIVYSQSGKVVQVSKPGDKNPVEVSLAINPKNPQNIIAAFLSYDKDLPGFTDFTYASFDGGLTWKEVRTDNPGKRIQGDDAVAFGGDGIAYHSYLSFYGLENEKSKQPSSGIFISSSKDGGLTWQQRSVVVDHINTSAPMEDKPYVVTDNSDSSKFENNVYVAWTHFQLYGSKDPADSSQIYFSRSIDSGKTFSSPIRISTTGGDCRDSSNTVEGAITAVGSKGEVYVVWAGPKGLVFTESLDGGKTFSPEKIIGFIYHGWDISIPGIDRANGMPVTKSDLSDEKYKGSIYVNWSDDRFGDPDIFLKYSRDGGKTWSNTIRVNNDSISNGKVQFFTWMAVDPVDGSVNIIFYDRKDTFGNLTGVTLARSIDGGNTFVNYKINIPPFDCNSKIFFGDYTGIDACDGFVIPSFMHFTDKANLTVSVALFHFKPGTQEQK